MRLSKNDKEDIRKGAKAGAWIFEIFEKIFPFLKTKKDVTQIKELNELSRTDMLKLFFKISFVVAFGVLFFTELITLPIFILNGKFSQMLVWLPYSLIPAAVIFVLLMLGGAIAMFQHGGKKCQ